MSHNSSENSWMYEDGYSAGESSGAANERKRILKWIDENRSYTEFDAGDGIYRDHFTSEDLVKYLSNKD
jgi:hypothetical protein